MRIIINALDEGVVYPVMGFDDAKTAVRQFINGRDLDWIFAAKIPRVVSCIWYFLVVSYIDRN